jgi:hypothetical protein
VPGTGFELSDPGEADSRHERDWDQKLIVNEHLTNKNQGEHLTNKNQGERSVSATCYAKYAEI